MPSNNTKLPHSLLLFMLLNTLLSLQSLPWSFMVLFAALILLASFVSTSYLRPRQGKGRLISHISQTKPSKILAYLLVVVSLILVWQQIEFPSLIAISALLTSLSWAKVCELKNNRDHKFIWFLTTSLLALHLIILIDQQMLIALIGIPLLFISASALNSTESSTDSLTDNLTKTPASKKRVSTSNKLLAIRLFVLLTTSLPFALILFITLPRINLPMQELGLIMGLPITVEADKNLAAKGLGQELSFGEIGKQGQSDARVLLAKLPSDYVQNPEQPLYWKGPVYWRYSVEHQGEASTEKWQLRKDFNKRQKRQYNAFGSSEVLANMASLRENTLEYSVILMPHGEYWLYALDLPQTLTGESYLSQDYQLLSIRKVETMWRYQISSSLNYQISEPEPKTQLTLGLQYPNNNPQIKTLGATWQQKFAQSKQPELAIIQHAKQFFTQGKYLYANTGDTYQGKHQLDQFLFTKKVGYSQHYASALTLLLRAAGIPTRLVAGYRGADKVGLTNMFTVNEHHAHAWVEAYITNNQGQAYWQRIDPALWLSDLFSSSTSEQASQVEQSPLEQEQLKRQNNKPIPPTVNNKPEDEKTNTHTQAQANATNWLDSLNHWTLEFDAQQQNKLAGKLGIKNLLWWHLLLIAFGGLLTLLTCYYLIIRVINRSKKTAEHIYIYQQLCRKLAKKGLAKLPHEGAHTYLTRCAMSKQKKSNQEKNQQNIKAEQILALRNRYLLITYSQLNNTEKQKTLQEFKALAARL